MWKRCFRDFATFCYLVTALLATVVSRDAKANPGDTVNNGFPECHISNHLDVLSDCYRTHCDHSSYYYKYTKPRCDEYARSAVTWECNERVFNTTKTGKRCYDWFQNGSLQDYNECVATGNEQIRTYAEQWSDLYTKNDSCRPSVPIEDPPPSGSPRIQVKHNGAWISNYNTIDLSQDWTTSFEIYNTGSALLHGMLTLYGAGKDAYTISQPPVFEIQPKGNTATFSVTFHPNHEGEYPADLKISSNDSSVYITLRGSFYPRPSNLIYCSSCENLDDFRAPAIGSGLAPNITTQASTGKSSFGFVDGKHGKGLWVRNWEKRGGRFARATVTPFDKTGAAGVDMAQGSVSFWASAYGDWRGKGNPTGIIGQVTFYFSPDTWVRITGDPKSEEGTPPEISFQVDGRMVKTAKTGLAQFDWHIALLWDLEDRFATGNNIEFWLNGGLFAGAFTSVTRNEINRFAPYVEIASVNVNNGDRTPEKSYAWIDTLKIWNTVPQSVPLRSQFAEAEYNRGRGNPTCMDRRPQLSIRRVDNYMAAVGPLPIQMEMVADQPTSLSTQFLLENVGELPLELGDIEEAIQLEGPENFSLHIEQVGYVTLQGLDGSSASSTMPGESVLVEVRYTDAPQFDSPWKPATLSIYSNDPIKSPYTIELWGRIIPPPTTEVVETGIKAIDLLSPLVKPGTARLWYGPDTNHAWLLQELADRVDGLEIVPLAAAELTYWNGLEFMSVGEGGGAALLQMPGGEADASVGAEFTLAPAVARQGISPALDLLESRSSWLTPETVGDVHYDTAQAAAEVLQRHLELRDIIDILGLEELTEEDQLAVARARKLEQFLSQPLFAAELFTGSAGRYVTMEETIHGAQMIISGAVDHVQEQAFTMIGSIDEAIAKGSELPPNSCDGAPDCAEP